MLSFWRKNLALNLFRYDGAWADSLTQNEALSRKKEYKPNGNGEPDHESPCSFNIRHHAREVLETLLTLAVIFGDYVMIAAGFAAASLLCQNHWIPVNGIDAPPCRRISR